MLRSVVSAMAANMMLIQCGAQTGLAMAFKLMMSSQKKWRKGASATRWPSREPVIDGQISIKAPLDVLDRFKKICKDDRRTYADMLGILMDGYEQK